MPNLISSKRHRLPYVSKEDTERRLSEVQLLLQTITGMDLHIQSKKLMLDRAIWLVIEITGNFSCRYRSAGVISSPGARLQRDHIYPRKLLILELLGPNPDFASIVDRAQCCLVTAEEHKLLSAAPANLVGFDRYKHAKVVYYDMLTHICDA